MSSLSTKRPRSRITGLSQRARRQLARQRESPVDTRCQSTLHPLAGPSISVVVPSHARRLRLRWLLNALEDQTLDPATFEVIVVHDYEGEDAALLDGHPLARDGRMRQLRIEPGTGRPSVQRNMGWRAASAPLVAFVDDDCRP